MCVRVLVCATTMRTHVHVRPASNRPILSARGGRAHQLRGGCVCASKSQRTSNTQAHARIAYVTAHVWSHTNCASVGRRRRRVQRKCTFNVFTSSVCNWCGKPCGTERPMDAIDLGHNAFGLGGLGPVSSAVHAHTLTSARQK